MYDVHTYTLGENMKHIVFKDEVAKLIIEAAREHNLSPSQYLGMVLSEYDDITPHSLCLKSLELYLTKCGITHKPGDQEKHAMAFALEGNWATAFDMMEFEVGK